LCSDTPRTHGPAGVNTVFVTHGQKEAFAIAHLTAVTKDGGTEQY